MKEANSRYLAIDVLNKLNTSKNPLPVLFDVACSTHKLSPPNRALAMTIIYGILRQRQYLEHLISNLCRQPMKKIHPIAKIALEVGLFQLFFLSRIPESAAVNETVNGAKEARLPKRLHGFINGVLRQSIRRREELISPEDTDTITPPILNHPDWLTTGWKNRFGEQTMRAICRYNNQRQPLVLRCNLIKTNRRALMELLKKQHIEATPGYYSKAAVVLPDYQGSIQELPGYLENLFMVQGEAAQLASLLLGPFCQKGRYLDGCAGQGGKTGHLIELLHPCGGHITAVEPEKNKLSVLMREYDNSGNKLTVCHDTLQKFASNHSMKDGFDGILVDAPCSGTGIIGKQPDIRWRRTHRDIIRFAEKQLQLLTFCVDLLKPGGVLVYATCSLEEEENSGVVSRLCSANPVMELTDAAPHLPDSCGPLIRENYFQPLPSDGIEGFFAARLVRHIRDD